MQTLIQSPAVVNIERVYRQMLASATAHYLTNAAIYPDERWENIYNIYLQAWSDDQGVDLSGFSIPAAPLADVTVNEDEVTYRAGLAIGLAMF